MNIRSCIIWIVLTGAVTLLRAQDLSNKGTEFWVGYGHDYSFEPPDAGSLAPASANGQEMVLYFSAEEEAHVTVTIKNTGWTKTYTVPAHSVIASDYMPKGMDITEVDCRLYTKSKDAGGTNSEGLYTQHGIHIESDKPIVAYAHIFLSASSGATMLMPVNTWGYQYMSVNSTQYSGLNAFSWAFVVASHDSTVVEITPTADTRNGQLAGVPFVVTLNKGDIYQILAKHDVLGLGPDLTGTRFRSIANVKGNCYPVGVFSGSSLTADPFHCGVGFADNDIQQVFPAQAWGRRYLTAPDMSSDNVYVPMINAYKVLVKDPATRVTVNGSLLTGLQNNCYYFESNTADLIEADKPIMVGQFMTGGACAQGTYADPDIVYISPLDQGIKQIGFFRNNQSTIAVNYLIMIVPNGGTGLSSVRIDGLPLSSVASSDINVYTHPVLKGYSVIARRWKGFLPAPFAPPGQCLVSCDSAFTAVTYGLGKDESYSYNAGTLINNLNAKSRIHNIYSQTAAPNAFTCVNTPVTLSALVAYKPTQITWVLSALADTIVPAKDSTDTNPKAVDSVYMNGTMYYQYSMASPVQFTVADTVYVPVILSSPLLDKCDHTEEINLQVIVKPEPKADFTLSRLTNCVLDTVKVQAVTKSVDGYSFWYWTWQFAGKDTVPGISASHVLPVGTNVPVKLTAITTEGCVADTVKMVDVYNKPVPQISVSPAEICEKGAYTVSGTGGYQGSGSLQWYWNAGDGHAYSSVSSFTETYNAAGEYAIKAVVKASELCVSDTVSKTVKVYAKPHIGVSYSEGCLPLDGNVVFTNTTATSDGQAIASHLWNFGDASATAANPNTSALAGPQHSFTYGKYDITYQAVSDKGCVADTVIHASFNQRPVFTFGTLDAVCLNSPAVSVAKAAVTNSVAGTGVYKGKGVTAAGMFTPSAAGAGVQTIWYVFAATSGCTDSIKQTIEVRQLPSATFTFDNNVCAGTATGFTPQATAPAGAAVTKWSWQLGDGRDTVTANGNAFTHNYAAYGTYTVTLLVTDDQGCTGSTVSQVVTVQPVPVAGFIMPDTICMPGGKVSFINTSTIAGNGALTYAWNFGDGAGASSQTSPSYSYAVAGSYNVQLTVTSAGNCVSTVVKVADKFYTRPVADFAVTPAELCLGEPFQFTDNSTAASSLVATWLWDFGDGTAGKTKSPKKTYSAAGVYTVQLVVKSIKGCSSAAVARTVNVHALPVIDAGPSFNVKAGQVIQLAAAEDAAYLLQWSPAFGLSDAGVLRPTLTVTDDIQYMLTATDALGCAASDTVWVKVLREVEPPNVFTPNGDGIHDVWVIPYLSDYVNAVVDVYNRYGQQVYHSKGYPKPWDGTMNGSPLPAATYYYVINLGLGGNPLSGSVTIIR